MMISMRKKPVIFLVFALSLIAFFFSSEIYLAAAKVVMQRALSKQSARIAYDRMYYQEGSFYLEEVDLHKTKDLLCYLKAKKIRITPHLKSFSLDLDLFDPVLEITKNEPFQRGFSTGKSSVSVNLTVSGGKILLRDNKAEKTFKATLESTKKGEYLLSFQEDSSLYISYDRSDVKSSLKVDTASLDLNDLLNWTHFFGNDQLDHIESLEGRAEGSFHLAQNEGNKSYFLRQKIQGLFCKSPNYQIEAKELFFEGYNREITNESKLLSFFLPKVFHDLQVNSYFSDFSISTDKGEAISQLSGTFSYHPEVGPKCQLKGLFASNREFDLISRGYFYSKVNNWLSLEINIDQERSLQFTAKEQGDALLLSADLNEMQMEDIALSMQVFSPIIDELNWIEVERGSLSCSLELSANHQGIESCQISSLQGNDLFFNIPSKFLHAKIDVLSLDSDFVWDKRWLYSLSTNLILSGGDFSLSLPSKKKLHFANLRGKITADKGTILPSHMSLEMGSIKEQIELSGAIDELVAKASFIGKANDLPYIEGFYAAEDSETLQGNLTYTRSEKRSSIFGRLFVKQDQDLVEGLSFGVDLLSYDPISALLFSPPLSMISQGWVKAEKLNLGRYGSWFDQIGFHVTGDAEVDAKYQEGLLDLYIQGRNLELNNAYLTISIPSIGDEDAHLFGGKRLFLSYDMRKSLWSMEGEVDKGRVYLPKYDLYFDKIISQVTMENNFLTASVGSALSGNISLTGTTYVDFNDPLKLDILVDRAEGSVDEVFAFASHFRKVEPLFTLKGNLRAPSNAFYLSTTFQGDTTWGFQGRIDKGALELSSQNMIEELKGSFYYDSEEDILHCGAIGGEFVAKAPENAVRYQFRAPKFNYAFEKSIAFDLRLEEPLWDVLRLVGKCDFTHEGLSLSFDSKRTEFFGSKLMIDDCSLSDHYELLSLKMASQLDLSKSFQKLQFLSDIGASPITNINLTSLMEKRAKGSLTANIDFNKESATIHIEGKDLSYEDSHFDEALFRAEKGEEGWCIKEAKLGDWTSEGFITTKEGTFGVKDLKISYPQLMDANLSISYLGEGELGFNCSSFEVNLGKITEDSKSMFTAFKGAVLLTGEGKVQLPTETKELDYFTKCTVDISRSSFYGVEVEKSAPLDLLYQKRDGITIRNVDLVLADKKINLSDFALQIEELRFQQKSKKWRLENARFFLPSNLETVLKDSLGVSKASFVSFITSKLPLERDFEITADIGFDERSLWWAVKKTTLKLENFELPLEDLLFSYSSRGCNFSANAYYEDHPYFVRGDLQLSKCLKGSFLIEDDFSKEKDQPLLAHWIWDEDSFVVKDINGNLSGMEVSFHEESPKELSGTVKFDIKKLSKLCPKSFQEKIALYGLGAGYEFRGKLFTDFTKKDFHFQGILSGKSFVLMDYELKTLLAKVDFSKDRYEISELKISDSAGFLKIPSITIRKEDDDYQLQIDSLQLREVRPSLLKAIGKEPEKITPLVIRKLDLTDFKGSIYDRNSFTGKGTLNFINSFKREYTLFDIPADFLGRIFGLDLELLIPVNGAIDFKVADGKVILTDLIESFSENQRSKFFLAMNDEPPYMDFDGNLHIHIKMKQYVLLKFTENFIITIKGTLSHPTFSLKRKKSFFSS